MKSKIEVYKTHVEQYKTKVLHQGCAEAAPVMVAQVDEAHERSKVVKHKTSELAGALLDAAVALASDDVAQCEHIQRTPGGPWPFCRPYSTEWSAGGEIIEREGITVWCVSDDQEKWGAAVGLWQDMGGDIFHGEDHFFGETPLIAAMRAFVASKFGDEVELP